MRLKAFISLISSLMVVIVVVRMSAVASAGAAEGNRWEFRDFRWRRQNVR